MKAMIFAAGLGTRLKPITDSIPKALVKVGDKSLLEITLDKLIAQGYDDIIVNVHHFASQIISFFENRLSKDNGDLEPSDEKIFFYKAQGKNIKIRISDETGMLLETGGALLHAKDCLLDGSFLIHNVDILSNANLKDFHQLSDAFFSKEKAIASLLVYDADSDRKLVFDSNMHLVGWTNTRTSQFKGPYIDVIEEKLAKGEWHAYAFSGIHVLNPKVLSLMSSMGYSGAFPIMEFYLKACENYKINAVLSSDLKVLDVGTSERLAQAALFLHPQFG